MAFSGALQYQNNPNNTGLNAAWIHPQSNRFFFNVLPLHAVYVKSDTIKPDSWGLKIILKAFPTPPSNSVPTDTIFDYTC